MEATRFKIRVSVKNQLKILWRLGYRFGAQAAERGSTAYGKQVVSPVDHLKAWLMLPG